MIDLENGIGSDQVREVSMTVEGTDMVVGYRDRQVGQATNMSISLLNFLNLSLASIYMETVAGTVVLRSLRRKGSRFF